MSFFLKKNEESLFSYYLLLTKTVTKRIKMIILLLNSTGGCFFWYNKNGFESKDIGLYLCLSGCKKIYYFDTYDIGFGRSSCRTTNTFDN